MTLREAQVIANYWKRTFEPFCDRIEIAGSIRREKPEVKDIELVCIPKEASLPDLFNSSDTKFRDERFIAVFNDGIANQQIEVIKGNPRNGKYVQFLVSVAGIKIDMFIATKDNWGYLMAIRTGSADYSHKVLASTWSKKGYHGEGGYLYRRTRLIPIHEEVDLFNLIGVPFIPPNEREYYAAP